MTIRINEKGRYEIVKYDTVIAIDPDSKKSGIGIVKGHETEALSLTLPEIVNRCVSESNAATTKIIIEAGWLNKSFWHENARKSTAIAVKVGIGLGENRQAGFDIEAMLKSHGLEYEEVRPLRKCWKGTDGKITHDELNKQLRLRKLKEVGRCNQDARDALWLAVNYRF